MEAVPLHLREANEFVAKFYRHNQPTVEGCGQHFHRHRKPKRMKGWFCLHCCAERGKLVWKQTG